MFHTLNSKPHNSYHCRLLLYCCSTFRAHTTSDIIRRYGCDVMVTDYNGDTPLHNAALGGSLFVVCTLIDEFKCDPNTKGWKGRIPLHCAAENSHVDIVRKLVHDYPWTPSEPSALGDMPHWLPWKSPPPSNTPISSHAPKPCIRCLSYVWGFVLFCVSVC